MLSFAARNSLGRSLTSGFATDTRDRPLAQIAHQVLDDDADGVATIPRRPPDVFRGQLIETVVDPAPCMVKLLYGTRYERLR